MFKVVRLEEFERKIMKILTPQDEQRIGDIETEIAGNPFTGKPLYSFFLREKRVDGKRVYFLIYEDLKIALMVSISDKKRQQQTIDEIKSMLPQFRKLAETASKVI